MDILSDASYYINMKITKIKVAEWGIPKKYLKILIDGVTSMIFFKYK
jgi:hypothetical protein